MYMELETIKHQLAQLSVVRADLPVDEQSPGTTAAEQLREGDSADDLAEHSEHLLIFSRRSRR
jgi:hypothetical protein